MSASPETHFLHPGANLSALCGAPELGPLDLNYCRGRISCERCRWQFAILTRSDVESSARWTRRRGNTVRLRVAA
jgi:hypothetical protein